MRIFRADQVVIALVAWLLVSPAVLGDTLALVGGTVIDGNGGTPVLTGVVLIADGEIVAVGAESDVAIPDGARVIDTTGKSILPGLADMHVHLVGGWDGLSVEMLGYRHFLNALLYAGVTTVFDTGNVMPYVLQMRAEIAAGRIVGPRIYSVGALVDGADPIWPPISFAASSAAQIPGIVAQLDRAGVDAVKAYVGLSVPMLSELVDEAAKMDLLVVADLWTRNGSFDVLNTGIAAIAHIPNRALDAPALELMQERDINVITTLATKESFARRRLQDLSFQDHPLIVDTLSQNFDTALREFATREQSEEEQQATARRSEGFRQSMETVQVMRDAGLTIVAGTDAPYPGVALGEGLHRELELLVEAGLTPLEAISTATGNAALLMNTSDWGTLEAGKRADLIVVDGRPDQNISDTRNIEIVIQKGQIIDRDSLKLDPAEDPGFGTGAPVDATDAF